MRRPHALVIFIAIIGAVYLNWVRHKRRVAESLEKSVMTIGGWEGMCADERLAMFGQ